MLPRLNFVMLFLGQPYMWKHHDVYDSRHCSVIITLGKKLYRISETLPTTAVSLITMKQCRKVISKKGKSVLCVANSEGEPKITVTSTTSTQNPSM